MVNHGGSAHTFSAFACLLANKELDICLTVSILIENTVSVLVECSTRPAGLEEKSEEGDAVARSSFTVSTATAV